MKIKIKQAEYQLYQKSGSAPGWLLLHGFMGSHADFEPLIPELSGAVAAPDLLGHGKTTSALPVADFTIEQQADQLAALIQQHLRAPLIVWGYSMGGRLALALALRHPKLIKYLILESSTAGINDSQQRLLRRNHDAQLAWQLRHCGLESFVNKWEELPLFTSQKKLPAAQQQFIRQQRLQQDPEGLAKSLLAMGTGSMPNYWPALSQLHCPVLLLTGALDFKFQKLTAKMAADLPQVKRYVVPAAGHNIHLENWPAIRQLFMREGLL
ncbi:MAG: 2-succinyl-6-hydroxy-2,4-cyclohexadiene-1-carboxylate synthase [Liquorilactobacillus ghanensis]|uniref:2-succinyl-6-hydroxy-2, 4-cyclohexadiene-1-carboxylate synthase n=1 Tax=Liquorilactobacillus ghanensis TaxID=399370 RepID=UPI0039E82E60